MKHGTKPTVAQANFLMERKLKPSDWLIERDTPDEMVIVHRYVDITSTIKKRGEPDG